MIEPIMAELQRTLYLSLLDKLAALMSGMAPNGSTLKPRASAFDGLIAQAAQRYDLDFALLKAVVQVESGFSANAVSPAGAKGLMQLMDSTAQAMDVADPFDPADNLDGGARFLRQLLDRYAGNVALALAAYNAGANTVDRWRGVPPYGETQAYVPRVLSLRNAYREWSA